MSYELNFNVDFEYNKQKEITLDECKVFCATLLDELKEQRIYEDASDEDAIADFAKFLHTGYGDCQSAGYSDNYFDMSFYIDYVKWLINNGYVKDNCISVEFTWDGEEPGDYTQKVFTIKKIDENFVATTTIMVPKVIKYDLNKPIHQ
jgi:hypothetical protein